MNKFDLIILVIIGIGIFLMYKFLVKANKEDQHEDD